ncbi:MAG TPA: universal stress protein, partial [Micromonosporaceae bacterium]|nr:universal stress protein [Micromonosporaceae bacterium]
MQSPVIVVGVDGSEASRAAVDWAAREAVRRGLDLRVISAYDWRVPGALAQIPSAYADSARAEAEG